MAHPLGSRCGYVHLLHDRGCQEALASRLTAIEALMVLGRNDTNILLGDGFVQGLVITSALWVRRTFAGVVRHLGEVTHIYSWEPFKRMPCISNATTGSIVHDHVPTHDHITQGLKVSTPK